MDSRIQKDGFEYVSFSGEPSEKYDTLIVNPENFAQAVQYIRKNEITRVHVEGHDWAETPCLDVSALSQCSGIRRLSAGGCVSGVQQLVDTLHLEWLSIDDRFIRERIDLFDRAGIPLDRQNDKESVRAFGSEVPEKLQVMGSYFSNGRPQCAAGHDRIERDGTQLPASDEPFRHLRFQGAAKAQPLLLPKRSGYH